MRDLIMNKYKPYYNLFGGWLNKQHLMKMTKVELEKAGREHGIELDRREKKEKLVEQLYKVL